MTRAHEWATTETSRLRSRPFASSPARLIPPRVSASLLSASLLSLAPSPHHPFSPLHQSPRRDSRLANRGASPLGAQRDCDSVSRLINSSLPRIVQLSLKREIAAASGTRHKQ